MRPAINRLRGKPIETALMMVIGTKSSNDCSTAGSGSVVFFSVLLSKPASLAVNKMNNIAL